MAFDKHSNGRRIDVESKLGVYHRVTIFHLVRYPYRLFQQFSYFFTNASYMYPRFAA